MNAPRMVRQAKYVGVRQLRENLAKVIKSPRFFFVTAHGKPVKAMVPYDTLLELVELLTELKDKTLLGQIEQGRKEYREGGFVSLRRLKKIPNPRRSF